MIWFDGHLLSVLIRASYLDFSWFVMLICWFISMISCGLHMNIRSSSRIWISVVQHPGSLKIGKESCAMTMAWMIFYFVCLGSMGTAVTREFTQTNGDVTCTCGDSSLDFTNKNGNAILGEALFHPSISCVALGSSGNGSFGTSMQWISPSRLDTEAGWEYCKCVSTVLSYKGQACQSTDDAT